MAVGPLSAEDAGGDDTVDSTEELLPNEGESPEDYGIRILRILQQIMKNNSEAMQQFFEILSNGDKNKAAYMMEILDKNLEQLEKQERSKGLKIFLKILSVVALLLSVLVVLINPTPFAVAMLMVSIALFMEPVVAEAAGYESLVGQAFKALFEIFKDMGMPMWAAAILMAVVVIVLVLVSAYGVAALGKLLADFGGKSFRMLSTTTAAGGTTTATAAGSATKAAEAAFKLLNDMLLWLKSFATENVKNIVFAADMTTMTATNAGEAAHSFLRHDVAKSQVDIDKLMAFVDMIIQSLDLTREDAIEFKRLIYECLEQIERMDLV